MIGHIGIGAGDFDTSRRLVMPQFAGKADRLCSLGDVVARIDADVPAPAKRGPYKKREKAA